MYKTWDKILSPNQPHFKRPYTEREKAFIAKDRQSFATFWQNALCKKGVRIMEAMENESADTAWTDLKHTLLKSRNTTIDCLFAQMERDLRVL